MILDHRSSIGSLLTGCNMDYIEEMHDHAFQNDVLIVAGGCQCVMRDPLHLLVCVFDLTHLYCSTQATWRTASETPCIA